LQHGHVSLLSAFRGLITESLIDQCFKSLISCKLSAVRTVSRVHAEAACESEPGKRPFRMLSLLIQFALLNGAVGRCLREKDMIETGGNTSEFPCSGTVHSLGNESSAVNWLCKTEDLSITAHPCKDHSHLSSSAAVSSIENSVESPGRARCSDKLQHIPSRYCCCFRRRCSTQIHTAKPCEIIFHQWRACQFRLPPPPPTPSHHRRA
jgi:hypothetical protein